MVQADMGELAVVYRKTVRRQPSRAVRTPQASPDPFGGYRPQTPGGSPPQGGLITANEHENLLVGCYMRRATQHLLSVVGRSIPVMLGD